MERELIKQQVIYEGRIVRVLVDTVKQPNGLHVVREVVRHPGGAVALPVLADGRVVLVRQYRHPTKKMLLELPAGKLEPDEPPEESVRRELEEEAGYRAGSIRKLCEFYTSPGFCDERLHLFLATDLQASCQQLEADEDAVTVEIYSPEQLGGLIARGEITDAKTLIGLLWLRTDLNPRP